MPQTIDDLVRTLSQRSDRGALSDDAGSPANLRRALLPNLQVIARRAMRSPSAGLDLHRQLRDADSSTAALAGSLCDAVVRAVQSGRATVHREPTRQMG